VEGNAPGSRDNANEAGKGGYGTCFCSPGTNFIEHYECRGTSFIDCWVIVPMQNDFREHWRGRGISITNLSWVQEQRQKP